MNRKKNRDTSFKIVPYLEGNYFDMYYVDLPNGNACEFIENLAGKDATKCLALLSNLMQVDAPLAGIMKNKKKVRDTRDGMLEIKPGRVRMPFFFKGRRIVFTHGYFKGTDKIQSRNIEKAKKIRDRVEVNDEE